MIRKTDKFDFNVREGTIPGITTQQYYQLQDGETVEVDEDTRLYLLEHGYAEEVT